MFLLGQVSSFFLHVSPQACPVPSLPYAIEGHVLFQTSSGLLASCGGYRSDKAEPSTSCLVLNPSSAVWESDPRVPDLPGPRYSSRYVRYSRYSPGTPPPPSASPTPAPSSWAARSPPPPASSCHLGAAPGRTDRLYPEEEPTAPAAWP